MAHEHSVIDTDTHFIIDGRTKVISFAGDNLPVIIQYDHNSERMTFELPRSIEGHDMTACNRVEVHYINIDKNTKQQKAGAYEVSDMTAPEDSADTVSFSWLISNQATQLIGPLSFLVKFKCVAEDGTVEYEWNTAKFTGLAVQDGINNTEVIAEEYADILAAWESRLSALEHKPSGVQTVNGVAPDDQGNVMLDMPEQVQSDLSVNDESDPAFVKGRTHYKTESLTINGVYNDSTYSYSMDVPTFPGFKESDAVTVIWDGTEYEVTAVATSSGVYVGNWSYKSYMSPDTGHPFLWYYGENSDGTAFSTVYAMDDKTHTIQIKDEIFSVPLDKKFLPLDSVYKSDLKDSMKPLLVEVKWSSIDSSGTISGITLDKSFDKIKKAWNENREIRWYKRNNETSTREYLTFKADWFTDTNSFPTLKGFYLQRIAVEHRIIYFYKIKITEDFGATGSRYTLSQA